MPRPTFLLLLLSFCAPALAQGLPDAEHARRAGPLDNGKMWLFEAPPLDYLEATYGFRPDEAWLERARLAALRLPNCSAAFVSADGLVATNHHCARGSIAAVTRDGENLLEDGFFAASLAEERRVPDLFVDQLVAIEDVTERVDGALARAQTDAERVAAREEVHARIARELAEAAGPGHHVQVVALYHGGRTSAYTFRRYTDVRLVAAPEHRVGYFGGDADNYTFPRYALDFAFYRVYGDDGRPLDSSAHFFRWSERGVAEGDLVFVIGNPGSTDRGDTVAQLAFRRDVTVPLFLEYLASRLAVVEALLAETPDDDLRNLRFSLSNSLKAFSGRRDALANATILARRADFEATFRAALEADPALRTAYGDAFDAMAALQEEKRELAAEARVFQPMTNPRFNSATLLRGIYAAQALAEESAGGDAVRARRALEAVADQPEALDRGFLAAQLLAFARHTPDLAEALLGGRAPEEVAAEVVAAARAGDAAPALALGRVVAPRLAAFQSAWAGLAAREQELARRLGRARFAVFGTAIPPDATFSLRFSDGVVLGYPYNGTVAPPLTTFWGMYDLHHAFGEGSAWELPPRWLPPPPGLDLSTPVNFVSTADTIGGNSGSPAVTPDLEVVGLNFDRNVEGLSRDYIYLEDLGRNVMVDARAVTAALEHVYGAEGLVRELRTGRAVPVAAR